MNAIPPKQSMENQPSRYWKAKTLKLCNTKFNLYNATGWEYIVI